MNRFIHRVFVALLIGILTLVTSCGKDEPNKNKYQGENKIFLSLADGTKAAIIPAENTHPIRVLIRLTRRVESPITLTLSIEGTAASGLQLSTERLTIPTGAFETEITITPRFSNVTDVLKATLRASSTLTVDGEITFEVHPLKGWTPTAEQQTLIESYKRRGIDLSKILGYHTVNGSLQWAGFVEGDYDYPTKAPKDYPITNAMMLVELSEKATSETPIFKFSYNAFGLNAVYKELWYGYTVNNTNYFAQQPSGQELMRRISWSSTTPETFNVILDNIRLDASKETLTFTGNRSQGVPTDYFFLKQDLFTENPLVVPFTYETSVWKRIDAEIKKDAQFGTEYVQSAEGIELYGILSTTSIDRDHGDEIGGSAGVQSHYVTPSGRIDLQQGTMTFVFPFHAYNSDRYSVVRITAQHK